MRSKATLFINKVHVWCVREHEIARIIPTQVCFISGRFRNLYLFKIKLQRTVLNSLEQFKTHLQHLLFVKIL